MQSQAQIDQVLRQKSDAKEIPGVVAMAATSKEVIYQGAFGKRDLSKNDAMTPDSVFWIASMTKAITAAGAMQLVEQGKLSLEAPIGKLLPDLAAPQVLEGFDAKGEPKLRPAKQPITLRHLLTHTAGFAYDMWNGDMVKYLEKTGIPGITTCKNDALEDAADDRPRHALGIRHQYRFRRQGHRGRDRQAARRLSPRSSVHAARHDRHRLQDRRRAAQASRRHAQPRRGRLAGADPVRARTGSGIPHGWRRPLRHRGRLHQVHPDDPQQGPRQRQPGAEAGDGRADGPEPHRRTQHDQDDVRRWRSPPTMSISIRAWRKNGG